MVASLPRVSLSSYSSPTRERYTFARERGCMSSPEKPTHASAEKKTPVPHDQLPLEVDHIISKLLYKSPIEEELGTCSFLHWHQPLVITQNG